MAWKFRQERVSDGDIVEPSEFRINTNEFVSELNGFLDSDNIKRQTIGTGETKRNTFTELIGPTNTNYFRGEYIYIFNHQLGSGWQDEAMTLRNKDFEEGIHLFIDADDVIIDGLLDQDKHELPSVTFRSDHDGLAIVELCGFVSWSKWHFNHDFPNQTGRYRPGDYGHAEPPWAYQAFIKQTKNFKVRGMYILCSQWRLTLNGVSVAETGPLGNEYQSHPIYLCGTAPVLKGKENVAKIEGRFFWFAPGDETSIEASSWAPTVLTSDGKILDDTYRRDCLLSSVNMLVTYRKR